MESLSTRRAVGTAIALTLLTACAGAGGGVPAAGTSTQGAAIRDRGPAYPNLSGEYSGQFVDNAYGKGKGNGNLLAIPKCVRRPADDQIQNTSRCGLGVTDLQRRLRQRKHGGRRGQPLLHVFDGRQLRYVDAYFERIVYRGARMRRRERDLFPQASLHVQRDDTRRHPSR